MPRQFGKVDSSASWSCPRCPHRHDQDASCPPSDIWLVRRVPSQRPNLIWLKRPMPNGQWPPDQRRPRDDSFRWWVRSHCGHQGGARQWAFHDEEMADTYRQLFRENPCYWTQCEDQKRRGGDQ